MDPFVSSLIEASELTVSVIRSAVSVIGLVVLEIHNKNEAVIQNWKFISGNILCDFNRLWD